MYILGNTKFNVVDSATEARTSLPGIVTAPVTPLEPEQVQNRKSGISVWDDFTTLFQSPASLIGYRQSHAVRLEQKTALITNFNDTYVCHSDNGPDPSRCAFMMKSAEYFAGGHILNCSAGDITGGYPLAAYFNSEHSIDYLNQMGLHFAVPGNQDFIKSVVDSQNLFNGSNFKWLLSNLLLQNGKQIDGTLPAQVVDVNGIKFGLVGLVGPWNIDTTGARYLSHQNTILSARLEVERMKRAGAEVIIALTHQENAEDYELARQVQGIDIILGGHDHDALTVYLEDTKTLIMKNGSNWSHLGVIAVRRIKDQFYIQFENMSLDGNIPRDPIVHRICRKYQDVFSIANTERRSRVLAKALSEIDVRNDPIRSGETTGGNLVADAFRAFIISKLSEENQILSKALAKGSESYQINPEDVIALTNSGGIRSDKIYPAGEITTGIVDDILQAPNVITVLPVRGDSLRKALESSVSRISVFDGRFPQVSGMSFELAVNAPEGNRIGDVYINGQLLDHTKVYFVVTNNFLADGGNGYDAFLESRQINEFQRVGFEQTMNDALAWYLEQSQTVHPKIEGRIVILDQKQPD